MGRSPPPRAARTASAARLRPSVTGETAPARSITRGAGALFRTAANGLEYASGDINGTQFALKEAMVALDAVGGQLNQEMRMLPRLIAREEGRCDQGSRVEGYDNLVKTLSEGALESMKK